MDTMTTPYTIGDKVTCSDGDCGELIRVIVDPVARKLTHLVVDPQDGVNSARLVPVDLVDVGTVTGYPAGAETSAAVEAGSTGVVLRCDLAGFEALATAEEDEFLPSQDAELGYAVGEVHWSPYYPLGGNLGAVTMGADADIDAHGTVEPQVVSYERVPLGEVQIRRGEAVHATDGDIGRVRGLIVDPTDNQVTHVLLDEGHLWGKKEIAIPISSATVTAEGIEVGLTKDEVKDLPSVEIGQHSWSER
jgi:hypothetical protein